LPNIKSSIRSVKTDAERRAKNAPIKAALRNAARKGIIHKNAAARKKSRLAKKINAL